MASTSPGLLSMLTNDTRDTTFTNRKEYVPFLSNPIPDNSSWVGKECLACQGWIPPKDTVKYEANLKIIPVFAVLAFVIGVCVNLGNWFHLDMKTKKHKDLLLPTAGAFYQRHRQVHNVKFDRADIINDLGQHALDVMLSTLPSEATKTNGVREKDTKKTKLPADTLIPSNSFPNTKGACGESNFDNLHRNSSVRTIADVPVHHGSKEKLRRKPSDSQRIHRQLSTGNSPLLLNRYNKVHCSANDPVPVVMYLDRAKLQRHMQRQLDSQQAQESPIRNVSSISDINDRKMSLLSSGYVSSTSNSRTQSAADISQATSLVDLCSDKINSPIQVLSPAVCDHLIINNLLSKSSLLLRTPPNSNQISPIKCRHSSSPNGYIEDCYIGSGQSSIEKISISAQGAISPSDSDQPVFSPVSNPDASNFPTSTVDTFRVEDEYHKYHHRQKALSPDTSIPLPPKASYNPREYYHLAQIINDSCHDDAIADSSVVSTINIPDTHSSTRDPEQSPTTKKSNLVVLKSPAALPPRPPHHVPKCSNKSRDKHKRDVHCNHPYRKPTSDENEQMKVGPGTSKSPPRPSTLAMPRATTTCPATEQYQPARKVKHYTVRRPKLELGTDIPFGGEYSLGDGRINPRGEVVVSRLNVPVETSLPVTELSRVDERKKVSSVATSPDSQTSTNASPNSCEWVVGDEFYSSKESVV